MLLIYISYLRIYICICIFVERLQCMYYYLYCELIIYCFSFCSMNCLLFLYMYVYVLYVPCSNVCILLLLDYFNLLCTHTLLHTVDEHFLKKDGDFEHKKFDKKSLPWDSINRIFSGSCK